MRINRAHHTVRTAAIALTAASALALTACQGSDDTAADSKDTASPTASVSVSASPSGSATKDAGSDGSSSTGGSSTGGSSGGDDSENLATPDCSGKNTKLTFKTVSRPINHLLLVATNTSSKDCDAHYYPTVRLGGAQSAPEVWEDSQPQAVVTLAPGESAYASVQTSNAAEDSGEGVMETSATVAFNSLGDGGPYEAVTVQLPGKTYIGGTGTGISYWQLTAEDALAW